MLKSKTLGRKAILLATIVLCAFLGANVQIVKGADSGCVTCHLDKEMLKNTVAAQKGKKSAMQSGAG
jgi:hypothetical protein